MISAAAAGKMAWRFDNATVRRTAEGSLLFGQIPAICGT
jgi:hypothetical protein